jgi:hypothetical protein
MLKKFQHLAEVAATNVSRRQVLGRFGRAAAAALLAGLVPAQTEAGRPGKGRGKCTVCYYACPDGSSISRRGHGGCAQHVHGCDLVFAENCGGTF